MSHFSRSLRRYLKLTIYLPILALVACGLGEPADRLVHFTGPTMGTTYATKIADPPPALDPDKLKTGIDSILERVNNQMSTYRKDSELSRFNANQTTGWVSISTELLSVIGEALEMSRLSDGAFDVTVGPLVNLWGFGPSLRSNEVPSDEEINEALQQVGYQHLQIRRSPPALRKDRRDIYVDLSAVAKGYAVDEVAEYLEAMGAANYLVEIGGELKGKGHNDKGVAWRIAIEKPTPSNQAVQQIIQIRDRSVATSGDYQNYFEHNGQRFSHTIDPRTGKPIIHNLASVTILSPSAMHADAMATALMVLGPEAGYELALREKLAAFFIIKGTDGFIEKSTPGFERYFLPQR